MYAILRCAVQCSVIVLNELLAEDTNIERQSAMWKWQLACSIVSLAICVIYFILTLAARDKAQQAAPLLSLFLALWWLAGAITGTFYTPFTRTGNGYFADWTAFAASFLAAYSSVSQFRQLADTVSSAGNQGSLMKPVMTILFASIIETFAAAILCDGAFCSEYSGYRGSTIYAVILGGLSIFCCLVLLIMVKVNRSVDSQLYKFMAFFLAAWWIAGAGVQTFGGNYGLFVMTGNGYFATWIACLQAVFWAFEYLGQTSGVNMDVPGALGVVLFASSVVVACCLVGDSRVEYYSSKKTWQFACGIVSVVLCIIWLILSKVKNDVAGKIAPILSVFLFFWWAAGAFTGTFYDPFILTGNGYFADWMAFGFSYHAAYNAVPQFRDLANKAKSAGSTGSNLGPVPYIFFASIIEMTSASILCSYVWGTGCGGYIAYAVAVGAVSAIICLILMIMVATSSRVDGVVLKVPRPTPPNPLARPPKRRTRTHRHLRLSGVAFVDGHGSSDRPTETDVLKARPSAVAGGGDLPGSLVARRRVGPHVQLGRRLVQGQLDRLQRDVCVPVFEQRVLFDMDRLLRCTLLGHGSLWAPLNSARLVFCFLQGQLRRCSV